MEIYYLALIFCSRFQQYFSLVSIFPYIYIDFVCPLLESDNLSGPPAYRNDENVFSILDTPIGSRTWTSPWRRHRSRQDGSMPRTRKMPLSLHFRNINKKLTARDWLQLKISRRLTHRIRQRKYLDLIQVFNHFMAKFCVNSLK